MKRQINTILTFCFAINIPSIAEECPQLIPQAPEAQAMTRAIDIPVGHYTGIPEISIPVYEINIGGFKMPVSISYHGGGISSDQEASAIGLGWTLNAGGMVTRTIRCTDDFREYSSDNEV